MDLLSSHQAATLLGTPNKTLASWADKKLVSCYKHDGRRWYDECYIKSLKQAAGTTHPSIPLVRLHSLYWSYRYGTADERKQAVTQARQLEASGELVTARQAAQRIGYAESCFTRWANQGRIQSLVIGRRRYLVKQYVNQLVITMGWLTRYEVAEQLGINANTPLKWIRTGKLKAYRTPTNEWRFDPREVEALARRHPVVSADSLTSSQVASLLGVSLHSVQYWAHQGLIVHQTIGGRRRYSYASVQALRRYASGRPITRQIVQDYLQDQSRPLPS